MLKPLLTTLFFLFVLATVILYLSYGITSLSVFSTLAAALVAMVEKWFDWLKPLREKQAEKLMQEKTETEAKRVGQELGEFAREGLNLLVELTAAFSSKKPGVTEIRKDPQVDAIVKKIQEWIDTTAHRLDVLKAGWGARFGVIAVPTEDECNIGRNQRHPVAGKLRLHLAKLDKFMEEWENR